MAAITFPSSPSVNDTFTASGKSWTWTGTVWHANATAHSATHATGGADELSPEAIGAASVEELSAHTGSATAHSATAITCGTSGSMMQVSVNSALADLEARKLAYASPPCSAGALTGTGVTFDSNDGPFQKSSVTGTATLNAPSNGSEGKTLKLWLNAATSDRVLTISPSILIPSDSGFTSPKTMTATKTYIVLLQHNGTAWMMVSFVGGY